MRVEEFDRLMTNALKNIPESQIYDFELDFTPAKISRKTKKHIKKLAKEITYSERSLKTKQHFKWRYLVAVIIGASILSIGVGGHTAKYTFTPTDAEMDYISIQPSADDKTSIEEVYELTYVLDGYKLTQYEATGFDADTVYTKGIHFISFTQCLISSDDTVFNTEDAVIETIEINDEEAIYIDCSNEYGDTQILIWTYDGYEFHLITCTEVGKREFSKDQVIEMAKTIQIKN